ncbi:phosphatase PAP2 family protein [Anaerolineales bacterium HSG6]|nr:phosphatase PAP2 family protein [Anaerolineales bacterium HSG6]
MYELITNLKQYDQTIARWVSHIISPHVVGSVMACLLTFLYNDKPFVPFLWLLMSIFVVTVPPIAYILWLVHTGHLQDFYMPQRSKRLRPLIFVIVWLFICLMGLRYLQAPLSIEVVILFVLALTVTMSIITLFWKISFHSASITTAFVTLVIVVGVKAWFALLLIPLVGWSRVRLQRHTPYQVLMGCLVGVLIALLMTQHPTVVTLIE